MLKGKYVIRRYDISLESTDVSDLDEAPAPIPLPFDLDDEVHSADNLLSNGFGWKAEIPHHNHVFDSRNRIAGCIGVDRRHATIMASVHRLKHVKRFTGTYLTDNNSVWPHSQRVPHQVSLSDLTLSFETGRPRLQPNDMRLLQLQFGGILNSDDAFRVVDELANRVE